MNYKSQLHGWAIDRVIELWKATPTYEGQEPPKRTLQELCDTADVLVDYCYEPEKDFKDTIAHVSQLLKTSPDAADKVDQLIAELGVIQEDIQRQAAMRKAVSEGSAANTNKPDGETIQ